MFLLFHYNSWRSLRILKPWQMAVIQAFSLNWFNLWRLKCDFTFHFLRTLSLSLYCILGGPPAKVLISEQIRSCCWNSIWDISCGFKSCFLVLGEFDDRSLCKLFRFVFLSCWQLFACFSVFSIFWLLAFLLLFGPFLDWHELRRSFYNALSDASSVGFDSQAISDLRRPLDLPWRWLVAQSIDFLKFDFPNSCVDFFFVFLALKYPF